MISEAGKADEHKRSELQRLYIKAREIINQLDDELINPLETSLGDIKMTLEENIRSLAPRDQYVVLVAGRNLKDWGIAFSYLHYPSVYGDYDNISEILSFSSSAALCIIYLFRSISSELQVFYLKHVTRLEFFIFRWD